MAFENGDVVIPKKQFDHIQERHVRQDLHPEKSKFRKNFHLVSCLARFTKRTWQDSDEYEILQEGFTRGHGHYYMYVFTLHSHRHGSVGVSHQEYMHLLCLATMDGWKISYHLSVSVFFKLSLFFEGAKIRVSLVGYPTKQNGSSRSHHMHKSQ